MADGEDAGRRSDVAYDVTHYQEDKKGHGDDAEDHCEALVRFSYHWITSPRCS